MGLDLKQLIYAEKMSTEIYSLIKYVSSNVKDDNTKVVGKKVKDILLANFTPSVFSDKLYAKNSLKGRISTKIFDLSKKIGLNKKFTKFDLDTQIIEKVMHIQRYWNVQLLSFYDADKTKNVTFVKEKLISVIQNNKSEQFNNQEIQSRLNQFIALLESFYKQREDKGPMTVGGRVHQTYFKNIFSNS